MPMPAANRWWESLPTSANTAVSWQRLTMKVYAWPAACR